LFCVGCSLFANAQQPEALPKSLIKFSPQHFVQETLKLGIETFDNSFSRSGVIYVSGVVGRHGDAFNKRGLSGIGLEGQYRKYISPMKFQEGKRGNDFFQGIFVAMFIQGGYYSGDQAFRRYSTDNLGNSIWQAEYDYNEKITSYAAGFTIGFQWIFTDTFSLETFVGGGFQSSTRKLSGSVPDKEKNYVPLITELGYRGALPKMGIQLGIKL
jgi:hypothetical protein